MKGTSEELRQWIIANYKTINNFAVQIGIHNYLVSKYLAQKPMKFKNIEAINNHIPTHLRLNISRASTAGRKWNKDKQIQNEALYQKACEEERNSNWIEEAQKLNQARKESLATSGMGVNSWTEEINLNL
ncbi:hypothetical protein AAEX28_04055 [Lentisphaerota bacterium WC36G]|nr:hypothetical protein LJT99_06925 [Lentisphaerae bacterium WC36]